MAEDNNTEGKENKQDKSNEFDNLKSEMNRKVDNIANKLEENKQFNKQVLDQINALAESKQKPPPAPKPEENWADLMIDDPARAVKMIGDEAVRKATAEMDKRDENRAAFQNRQASVLTKIAQDFPETGDANHPLTKRAVELHSELSPQEQADPVSYRTAVLEAASELGILKKSKRKQSDTDDFVLNGDGGPRRRKTEDEVSDNMLGFAQAMGLNPNDSKLKDRLKKHSGRNWAKYQ
jgi:hypothetical protein